MRRYDLFLFDLDGTLVDSVPDIAAAVDETLQHEHLPPAGLDAVRQWIGNGSLHLIERALRASGVTLSADTGGDKIAATHEYFLNVYQQHLCHRTVLYPDVLATLQTLQQLAIPMAIVTNKPIQFVPALLRYLHIDSFFNLTVGGDSLARKKPDPLPLRYCCEQLQVACSRTLMVGDSIHDVMAAKSAAMDVAAVNYGYNHGDDIALTQPTYVIHSLRELCAFAQG